MGFLATNSSGQEKPCGYCIAARQSASWGSKIIGSKYRLSMAKKSKKTKQIYGGALNDTLYSVSKRKSEVYGLEGDDTIFSRIQASDYLYGGADNDTLYGGSFTRLLSGDSGDDIINAVLANDQQVLGGDGNDRINYRHQIGSLKKIYESSSRIDGGNGDDQISIESTDAAGEKSKLFVFGGAGDDKLDIRSHRYDDIFTYDLGAGNDTVSLWKVPEARDVVINGGDGFDVLKPYSYSPNPFDLLSEVRLIEPDTYALVFRAYQLDGIGYEQIVAVPGFEAIINNYTKQYMLADLAQMGANIQWV